MQEHLFQFVSQWDSWVQVLAVSLVSAIPFVESYFGSAIGVVAGMPLWLAVPAAVVGNWISMFVLVLLADKTRGRFAKPYAEKSKKRERFERLFNRWGVPGVSLIGQTVLPSQITSAAMVGAGASPRQVILWQSISIVIWGLVFGSLAMAGLAVLF
ncbi:membrane protein DedA with SNARE-associated domain [Neomicrococcus aestuarii]|uniref:Membrane protein DedA with SNARE-associated domain n=1 Tax=Neomicrococcus aestuarii TaxID=556325 RepID=A0A7W8TUC4_9MICC|nr:small multi-drug export protein [Neomicrococcus aestuarii]MBB5513041.1 membrane protein DedA with SNARE-associated domain [Neomicrococcus aestuarii]